MFNGTLIEPDFAAEERLRDATDVAIAAEEARKEALRQEPDVLVACLAEPDVREFLTSLLRPLFDGLKDNAEARFEMSQTAEWWVNYVAGE